MQRQGILYKPYSNGILYLQIAPKVLNPSGHSSNSMVDWAILLPTYKPAHEGPTTPNLGPLSWEHPASDVVLP